jgi:hypothetical protein
MKNLVQKPSIAQGMQYQGLSPADVDAQKQTNISDLREKRRQELLLAAIQMLLQNDTKNLTGEDY